jgi:aspartyl/glutamyl-tRNA(Asn/Gln) amidotransferase C subunit
MTPSATKRLPPVDVNVLKRLLQLAMIHDSESRQEFLLKELNRQCVMLEEVLDAAAHISAGSEDVEPTMYGVSFSKAIRQDLREDIVEEFVDVALILKNSPRPPGPYFVVPAVS